MSSNKELVLYNDLNKTAVDLLTKDFPTTHKFEVKAAKGPGLGFEASMTEKDGTTVGVITPKYQIKNEYGNTTLSASRDTRGNNKMEVVSQDLVVGLKATLTASDAQTVSTAFEYRNPNFTSNATLNLLSPKGTTGVIAVVVGYQDISVGVQDDFNLSTKTINDINANVTFNPVPATSVSLYARFKKNTLGMRALHRFPVDSRGGKCSVAAEAEANYVNRSESPKFTLGTEYSIDDKNTIKGKFESTGHVGVSFITKLSQNVKAAFATTVNTNNFSSNSKATYGLSITIE